MKSETDELETAVTSSLPFLNQIPIVFCAITGMYHNQALLLSCSKKAFFKAWQSTHLLQAKNGIGGIHVF